MEMSLSEMEYISLLLLIVLKMFCHPGQHSPLGNGNVTSRRITFGLKSVFFTRFFFKTCEGKIQLSLRIWLFPFSASMGNKAFGKSGPSLCVMSGLNVLPRLLFRHLIPCLTREITQIRRGRDAAGNLC